MHPIRALAFVLKHVGVQYESKVALIHINSKSEFKGHCVWIGACDQGIVTMAWKVYYGQRKVKGDFKMFIIS